MEDEIVFEDVPVEEQKEKKKKEKYFEVKKLSGLRNGKILVVNTKGDQRWVTPDAITNNKIEEELFNNSEKPFWI